MTLSHVVRIPIYNEQFTFSSTYPTNEDIGCVYINGDHWDGIEWVRIEGYMQSSSSTCLLNGIADMQCQMYNFTDSSNVGSQVTIFETFPGGAEDPFRSASMGITSFASGYKKYIVKLVPVCSGAYTMTIRRMSILIGVSTAATKFSKYIEMGASGAVTGTTYSEISAIYGPKRWDGFDSSVYSTATFLTLDWYATLKSSNASYTASCKLYDVPDLTDLGEVTTTSTSYTGVISEGITEPLAADHELQCLVKSSNAIGITSVKNATLVIQQTGSPTSSREVVWLTTYAQNQVTITTYDNILRYGTLIYASDYPQASSSNWLYAFTGRKTTSGTTYGTASDKLSALSGFEATTTSTSNVLTKSGTNSDPLDFTDYLSTMYKVSGGSGFVKTDYVQFDQAITYPVTTAIKDVLKTGLIPFKR